jgi:DNA-binding transcriptional MerR regulator
MSDNALLDKISSQTKIQTKDLGELFEYNISNPVTIKRKQSGLVPILTESIQAKRVLLYNMNDHEKNPNACLEITNNTNLTLERGPSTIIYDDNLAGEAIIPFLNKGDTRLLNYAVEQAVLITHEQESENKSVHKVTFGSGYSYEYYYTDLMTTYKIKNKTEEVKELYLDHPKTHGYKFIEKPIDPEETPNYWRFKLTLKPKDAINFILKEQREDYSSNYLWDFKKEDFLKRVGFYVKQKFINPDLENQLKEIAELIQTLNNLRAKEEKLNEERDLMTDEQVRLRENISVLGDDTQSVSLKERYVKKLNTQESRFEAIKKELKTIDKKMAEINKNIAEKMDLLSPP